MAVPNFKRTHVEFTGGDDINGVYVEKQEVRIVRQLPDNGQDDEEEDMWRVRLANGKEHSVDGCDMHPHPEAHTSNIEAVTHLMNFGSTAFVQVFLMEAAIRYADQLLADEADTRKQMANHFVSADLMIDTAHEVRDYLNAHLKP